MIWQRQRVKDMDDVFLELADKLKELPEQLENGLIKATKKAVDKAIGKMAMNLKNGAPKFIADHQLPAQNVADSDYYYAYKIDWENKVVNTEKFGWKYPSSWADRPRLSGKRNFSIAPATYADLAYIIDAGYITPLFTKTGESERIVAGTNFIKKARRNAKSWVKKRDQYALAEMIEIANKLDKG